MNPDRSPAPPGQAPAGQRARSGRDPEVRAPGNIGKAIVLTDALVITLAVATASFIAHHGHREWGPGSSWVTWLGVGLVGVWLVLLWQRQSREAMILGYGAEEYRRVVVASAWTITAVAAIAFFTDGGGRGFLLLAGLLGTICLLLGRWVMRRSLQRTMTAGHPILWVYVLAPTDALDEVDHELGHCGERLAESGRWILDTDNPEPAAVIDAATASGADAVLLVARKTSEWTGALAQACSGTSLQFLMTSSALEVAGAGRTVTRLRGTSFSSVREPSLPSAARITKRVLDIVGATVGLLVFALPMALIALVIKATSTGPVLFRQVRIGRDGRPFDCLKFRTMTAEAPDQLTLLRLGQPDDEATFKLRHDPRTTRIGRLLRRTSLDELPQLWNVLADDMSLVGPRPHQVDDVLRYDRRARGRLRATPGMTGLWQVSGRSNTTWDENVDLDLHYIANWSLTLDLLILARTVKVVASRAGAY